MKPNTIATIITYNPDIIRLKENISSVINQVRKVLVIDNGSINISRISEVCIDNSIELLKHEENHGIAYALNVGLNYANKNGFEYILSLDQDSVTCCNMVEVLMTNFIRKPRVAMVGPKILDLNIILDKSIVVANKVEKTNSIITSGSISKVEILLNIGGYLEDLFIDSVDFEMCWRLKKNEFDILKDYNVYLNHEIGKKEKKKFLFWSFHALNHNTMRSYYMARNRVILIRKYSKMKDFRTFSEVFGIVRRVGGMLLYEKKRCKKMATTIKGIISGIKYKM